MADEKTVRDILELWLRDNGYDGLVDQDCECGCGIDNLIYCDGPCETCRPGHSGPDPSGECDFLIYPTREAAVLAQENIDAERHAEDEEPEEKDDEQRPD